MSSTVPTRKERQQLQGGSSGMLLTFAATQIVAFIFLSVTFLSPLHFHQTPRFSLCRKLVPLLWLLLMRLVFTLEVIKWRKRFRLPDRRCECHLIIER